jgi:hypothetical protein
MLITAQGLFEGYRDPKRGQRVEIPRKSAERTDANGYTTPVLNGELGRAFEGDLAAQNRIAKKIAATVPEDGLAQWR